MMVIKQKGPRLYQFGNSGAGTGQSDGRTEEEKGLSRKMHRVLAKLYRRTRKEKGGEKKKGD